MGVNSPYPPSRDPVLAALARTARWKLVALAFACVALVMPCFADGSSPGLWRAWTPSHLGLAGWSLLPGHDSDLCALPRAVLGLGAMCAFAYLFLRRPTLPRPSSAAVFLFWAGTVALEAYPFYAVGDALWNIGSGCGAPLQWSDFYDRTNLERHVTPGTFLFAESFLAYALLSQVASPFWLFRAMRLQSERDRAAHVAEGPARAAAPPTPPRLSPGVSARTAFLLLAVASLLLPWDSVHTNVTSWGGFVTVPGRGVGFTMLLGAGGTGQLGGSWIIAGCVVVLFALATAVRPRVAVLGDRARWLLCAAEMAIAAAWGAGLQMTVSAWVEEYGRAPLAQPVDPGAFLCLQALLACAVESIVFAARAGPVRMSEPIEGTRSSSNT